MGPGCKLVFPHHLLYSCNSDLRTTNFKIDLSEENKRVIIGLYLHETSQILHSGQRDVNRHAIISKVNKKWSAKWLAIHHTAGICDLYCSHTGITLLTYLLTPWSRVLLEKPTGFAANQEIPRILWTPKVHYRTHKRTPPVNNAWCLP